jgi:hypothetical protein
MLVEVVPIIARWMLWQCEGTTKMLHHVSNAMRIPTYPWQKDGYTEQAALSVHVAEPHRLVRLLDKTPPTSTSQPFTCSNCHMRYKCHNSSLFHQSDHPN